jgi:hypothetical protein
VAGPGSSTLYENAAPKDQTVIAHWLVIEALDFGIWVWQGRKKSFSKHLFQSPGLSSN